MESYFFARSAAAWAQSENAQMPVNVLGRTSFAMASLFSSKILTRSRQEPHPNLDDDADDDDD